MKKTFFCAVLLSMCSTVKAQFQVSGDFESDWVTYTPWDSNDNANASGTTPQGWSVSNIYNALIKSVQVASPVEGYNSDKAVKLRNINAVQNIPAYLTLGTTWATAQAKGLGTTKNEDGGTFGGKSFDKHPDAVSFYYKRENGGDDASFVAYLWKGTFTQKDVPGNTTYKGTGFVDPTLCTMNNRDRQVLGYDMSKSLGGATSQTTDAVCVAKVDEHLKATTTWTKHVSELDYGEFAGKDVKVENINIIFAANDYFANRSSIVKDNTLTIDNVELVYYHALKSLAYNDAELSGFSADKTNYDLYVTEDFDPKKVAFKKKGQGATASSNYSNGTYTITVKGEDYDASTNPTSMTTYTINVVKVQNFTSDLLVNAGGLSTAPEKTSIQLLSESDGSKSLELKNFKFAGAGIGNIKLTNLEEKGNIYTKQQEITITEGDDPEIGFWMGPQLGVIPVNAIATVNGDQMVAQITIKNFPEVGNINVTFAPTITIGANASVSTEAGVNNVIVNRTFAKGWNTVCLPFDVAVAGLQATKAQEFVSSNGSSLTFNEVADGVLKANVPYLVFFDNEVSDPFYYGGKVEATNPTPVEHSGFTFVGNYETSKSMEGLYGVASEGDVQKIMLGTATSTLPATCAYFTTKNMNANGLRICFDGGEVTGINQVNGAQAQSAGAVYNLQGIKVSNHGTNNLPAGLYIMQGKKVIVK